jgi:hypothetical protein
MPKKIIAFICVILFFITCNQSENKRHDDPLESGREFIDASLKGNYDIAKKYLLQDSVNIDYFNGLQQFNNKLSDQQKEGYKNANIIINSADNVSDSVMIINYSNTFKNSPSKIKMVRINKEWFVDFKYTFSGNM